MVSMSLDWWWPVSSSYFFLLRPSHTCLIAAVWVVLASLAVLLYQYYHNHHGNKHESGPLTTSSSRRLPPGSRGLPLLGETLRLIGAYKTADPEPFIDERVARHGSRVFTTHLFGETTVFSADPDVNRTVVQGEGRTFESSYPSSVATLLGPHSLVLTKGAAHRRLHSLVLGAFANKGTLREALLPDVDAMVRRSLDGWWKWEEKGEGVTGGEDQSGKVLRLMDQAKKITFELAVKQLMSEEPGEWTEGLRRHYLAVIDGFFSLPISFLPFSTYRRALKARAKVAEQIRAVVRRRKHEMSMMMMSEEEGQWSGKAGATTAAATALSGNKVRVGEGRCRDVLDALLVMGEEENNNSSHDSEDGDSRKKKKTESELEEEVVDFLLALLIAGYETTPTIMTVLVKFITECPRALAMLKEEHEAIRSRKKDDLEPLDWSDCKTSMPFTQCVINESLRLANIISGVFRRATTDVNIKGGYTIPKGTKVFASFRGVHLAEEFHHDARTFNPWRWTAQAQQQEQTVVVDQQQQHTVKQQQQQAAPVFTPFGGGPRMCPGYELARVEISVFLHYFVTAYTWEPAGEDTLVHFPTARLLNSYPVRLLQRHRALV